jgi:ArsR family transcriptional regulator
MSECCAPLQSPLSDGDARMLARVLKALADPARLRLVSLIASQPNGEACNCDLIEPLGLSQPTVSHHMRVLHEAGLLARERRGQWVYYRIVPEQMSALRAALDVAPSGVPV